MTPASDTIDVAVIGFGLGGRVFHAPLVESTPGMRVSSIVTSDPERQAQARQRYPDVRILDRADRLWDEPAGTGLVVITTPNRFHGPLAMAAFDAGLPVVVDKPFAPTSAEADGIVTAAGDRALLLSVFQNRRWDGDFLTVRRLLAEDAIGPVVRFESRFERWQPERKPAAWREWGGPEEAGGLLFDLGSHLIDQAMVLFGPPTHVYAECDRRREGAEVDDDTFVALTHAGGERSHLWASVLARTGGPRMRLLGRRGAYTKYGLDAQEPGLAGGAAPGGGDWGREAEEHWGTLATADGERKVETEPGAYPAYYAGIARSLREGAPPPVDPTDSVTGLRVIEAAARSAATGTVQAL